mmetsp:Transcript_133030/g.315311  ORF Transcript_133030/g.315311 Transcript_133030/m.315311 type:complete len:219 (+) Transcript_133030:249-905(+)
MSKEPQPALQPCFQTKAPGRKRREDDGPRRCSGKPKVSTTMQGSMTKVHGRTSVGYGRRRLQALKLTSSPPDALWRYCRPLGALPIAPAPCPRQLLKWRMTATRCPIDRRQDPLDDSVSLSGVFWSGRVPHAARLAPRSLCWPTRICRRMASQGSQCPMHPMVCRKLCRERSETFILLRPLPRVPHRQAMRSQVRRLGQAQGQYHQRLPGREPSQARP